MRIKREQLDFIKNELNLLQNEIELYLFGSRTNDMEKGGDIDLLILSDKPIEKQKIRDFRIKFYRNFGWQKIDIVTFLKKEKHPFKNIALETGIKL